MKATDLLRLQHREAAELLERLQGRLGYAEAEKVTKELATVLGAHMLVEQEIFYPALALALDDRKLIRESYEEHAEIADELRKLLGMAGNDPGFKAQVAKLRELIEQHVAEEETHHFRKAEPIIGEKQLEVYGGLMEARFDEGIELGYEVTTAEGAIEPDDVDHILAQYTPMGERLVPKRPGAKHTIKTVAAPDRRAAAKRVTLERGQKAGKRPRSTAGGRRRQKTSGEGARKTREGWRSQQ
jgi:hypothetical protein